jgi:alanyl-tRNA synthetase
VLKVKIRETLSVYGKKVVAWKKEKAAELTAEVTAEVIATAERTEGEKVICRVDVGCDTKAVKAIQQAVTKTIKDKAFFLVSADESADRYVVVAFCHKSLTSVDCNAWASAAIEGTGGKGGGKKDSAQYTVSGISTIETVLGKARAA